MKVIALFLACLIWLCLLFVLKINLKFSYAFQNFNSQLQLDFKILFAHLKIELNIPKEMYSSGLEKFLSNVLNDLPGEKEAQAETPDKAPVRRNGARRIKTKRYRKIKRFTGEVFRHYVTSWARLVWLKRQLTKLKKYFYRKIKVYSFQVSVQVGGRDAAETGLLVGAFWVIFGQITARLYRLVTVTKTNIRCNVSPRFDQEAFLCRLNCILSLKISHIIFTGYKFLLMIIKNRRIRNYGRASD